MLRALPVCESESLPREVSPGTGLAAAPPVTYKPAETIEEFELYYRLVHDNYVERGYIRPQPSGMRLTIFNALPNARTFIAAADGRLSSCLTLIPDSPLGLPMDEIYGAELDALRKAGRKVAEVSGFVSDRSFAHASGTFLNLIKCLYAQALVSGVDDICIAVNPCHRTFYEKGLGFRVFGDLKRYSSVNYAPAYALCLRVSDFISHVKTQLNRLYRFMSQNVGEFLKHARLDDQPAMSEIMLRYFFCLKTDILRQASFDILHYVVSRYPHYDFRRILGGRG